MKDAISCYVTPCGSCKNRLLTLFLARRFLSSWWRSDTFLWNVGSYKSHTAWHPRRRHSLWYCVSYICCSTFNSSTRQLCQFLLLSYHVKIYSVENIPKKKFYILVGMYVVISLSASFYYVPSRHCPPHSWPSWPNHFCLFLYSAIVKNDIKLVYVVLKYALYVSCDKFSYGVFRNDINISVSARDLFVSRIMELRIWQESIFKYQADAWTEIICMLGIIRYQWKETVI
jgi:hypothetical protein